MLNNGPHTSNALADHWSVALSTTLVSQEGGDLVFEHRGVLDQALLDSLLMRAETASLKAGENVALRKRLFNVLVEALENLHRHAAPEHRDSMFAVLVRREGGYRLMIGNALPLATAALLVHRITVLNEMGEVDLKEHFLRLLATDGRTHNGGAGLGLVTMARKSTRPMVVHTLPKDVHNAFFALELTVLLN